MSKIESVSVSVVRVPLDRVTSFATRTVSARDYCLVKVRSTEGVEGIGFCYVGSAGGRIAQVAVEELFAPKLIGQDSFRVEGLWQTMYAEALLQGRAGSVMRAISILDTALWDLNARSVSLPLYKLPRRRGDRQGARVCERRLLPRRQDAARRWARRWPPSWRRASPP